MIQEIDQLEMPVHQLVIDAPPSVWTEIGKAEITHNIFGKARVRIIRKNDNARRALWLVALLGILIAVAAWQGWFAQQQTTPQSEETPALASAKEQEITPAFQPAITSSEIPQAAVKQTDTPVQNGIKPPATILAPQQAPGMKGVAEQNSAKTVPVQPMSAMAKAKPSPLPAKPMAPQPKQIAIQSLKSSQPQSSPLATNNNVPTNPADKVLPPKLPSKLSTAIHSASPAAAPVVATPRTSLPVVQPAASSPAALIPLSGPLEKEDTSAQSPAAERQVPSPAGATGK